MGIVDTGDNRIVVADKAHALLSWPDRLSDGIGHPVSSNGVPYAAQLGDERDVTTTK